MVLWRDFEKFVIVSELIESEAASGTTVDVRDVVMFTGVGVPESDIAAVGDA